MLKTKFLEPNSNKNLKFLNFPTEIQYHTLNFLKYYNLPIHVACKNECNICKINQKIELKNKDLILDVIGRKFNKRPYPEKKIEYVILTSELVSQNGKEYFDYYFLKLKPRQLLQIINYFLVNEIENACSIEDDTIYNVNVSEFGTINDITPLKYKKWIAYDIKKFSELLDKINSLNIYDDLNIVANQTDIDTIVHIYATLVKEAILSLKEV